MIGNFDFVRTYNPELYKRLNESERELKHDFVAAGKKLRSDALEYFVNNIINKYELSGAIRSYCSYINRTEGKDFASGSLQAKLAFLSDADQIRRLRSNRKPKVLECKYKKDGRFDLAYYRVSAKYRDANGNEVYRKIEEGDDRSIDPFNFIRWVGNACSHDDLLENEKPIVKKTYENVLEAFKVVFHILACFYDHSVYDKYSELRIPLKGIEIETSFVPSDSELTDCIREYEAKELISKSEDSWKYYIIREYNQTEEEHVILRGYEAIAAVNNRVKGLSSERVNNRNIINFDSEKNHYYVVAYQFESKPEKLADVIADIDLKYRYEICLQIAEFFEKLHTLKAPIYHRMLNYNSIYIHFDEDRIPFHTNVLKFNFSKITPPKDKVGQPTVRGRAIEAFKKIADSKEAKYLAPEWSSADENTNWEKIDIFSLGVLFFDILSGKILRKFEEVQYCPKQLISIGVPKDVILTIGSMIDDNPDDRPSITSVIETLEKHQIS